MNDLERDLHELFDQRSRDVDPAVLAPDAIIRRGHRRQARTAVGGVLAGVVVIAVAVAAVGSIQRSDGVTPAGTNDLPARATHIGGVPVTAPAGWTLIDDTPLLNVISTSTQSCSFSASGTAVERERGARCGVRTGAGAILGLHVGACRPSRGGAVPAARELRAAPHGVGVRLGRRNGGILAGRRRGGLRRRVPVRSGNVDVARRLSGRRARYAGENAYHVRPGVER